MSPTYIYPVGISKLINDVLNQREMIEAQRRINYLCRERGYNLVKGCSSCFEICPRELRILLEKKEMNEKEIKKFRKILSSVQGTKKLLRRAYIGGISCSHYNIGSNNGLVFSQEYQMKLAYRKLIDDSFVWDLSLGRTECHGYGNCNGRQEFLFENCKNKLGIPEDATLKSIDPSQIIENMKPVIKI